MFADKDAAEGYARGLYAQLTDETDLPVIVALEDETGALVHRIDKEFYLAYLYLFKDIY